jgi:spore coat protein U-like protein
MKVTWFLISVSISVTLFTAKTYAACNLTLNASNISITWNQNFNYQAINFSVTKTNNPPCDIAISFTAGGSADFSNRRLTYLANTLNYQLYKNSSLTKVLKDGAAVTSSDNYLSDSFSSGSNKTQNFTYYVQIPQTSATTPTYKPSGTYVDTFSIKVFENTEPTGPLRVSSNVTISTLMPKLLEISMVQTGGGFNSSQTTRNIDFGSISEGESRGFDLLVRSNAGYSVSMASQNNGRLKHTTPSITSFVPYQLLVNSSQKDLSNGSVTVAAGPGQTSTAGVANEVTFIAGSTASSVAGNYSDNITVTVITTE